MGSNSAFDVIVVGAGATGLLVAQGLKKNGIPVTVLERSAKLFREDGNDWAMAVHWARPLLPVLLPEDLNARLRSAYTDPNFDCRDQAWMPILNGQTGEELKRIPLEDNHRVGRNKFRQWLMEGIDVKWNVQVASLTETDTGITITTTTGSNYTASVVIGTDGAKSIVRKCMYPNSPTAADAMHAPYNAVRILAQYPDAPSVPKLIRSIHPIQAMFLHPSGRWCFMATYDVPDAERPETWIFQLTASWPAELASSLDPHANLPDGDEAYKPVDQTTLAELKEKMSVFADPLGTAYAALPDNTVIRGNRTSYWNPLEHPGWHNFSGRVTLAGDAAHPMTFHRGQGLNHAVKDAANFVTAMVGVRDGKVPLREAMEGYETEMRERGGAAVAEGLINTRMVHQWDDIMKSPLMAKGAGS